MSTDSFSAASLLEAIYDEEVGLRLMNFSIKPVHVANGLARAITNRAYDTTALTRTLRRYVRLQKLGVDEERNPNDAILREYGSAFESFRAAGPDSDRLTHLRVLAFDVLGADGAVFDQSEKSSFTLANEHFVTRDPSDFRAGSFLARLLTAEPRNRTDAATLLRELLTSEADAWTTIALPLLQFCRVQEGAEGKEASARAAKAQHLFAVNRGRLSSPTLRKLREGYDRLARVRAIHGGWKLKFPASRLVLFGCFAVHVHVISRWSERDPEAPRPPILLDLLGGAVGSVRDASRASLRSAGDAIEGLIRLCVHEFLVREYGSTPKAVERAVHEVQESNRIRAAYESYRGGGANPLDAASRAIVEEAFERPRGEHPVGALIEDSVAAPGF